MADSKYPTIGGQVTRGEVYMKIIHQIDELQDSFATMGHLHGLQDNHMDGLLAKGWIGMSEMMRMVRIQVTELAKKNIQ